MNILMMIIMMTKTHCASVEVADRIVHLHPTLFAPMQPSNNVNVIIIFDLIRDKFDLIIHTALSLASFKQAIIHFIYLNPATYYSSYIHHLITFFYIHHLISFCSVLYHPISPKIPSYTVILWSLSAVQPIFQPHHFPHCRFSSSKQLFQAYCLPRQRRRGAAAARAGTRYCLICDRRRSWSWWGLGESSVTRVTFR